MNGAEWIEALRAHGGFRALPLLDTTGEVSGLHLHRFDPGSIRVIQTWHKNYAVDVQLQDQLNAENPFMRVPLLDRHVGTIESVAGRILYPPPRHGWTDDRDQDNRS